MVDVSTDLVLLKLTNDFDIHKDLLQAVDVFYRNHRKCDPHSSKADENYAALRTVVFRACRKLYDDWAPTADRAKTSVLTEDVFCHYWEHVSHTVYMSIQVRRTFRNNWTPEYARADIEQYEAAQSAGQEPNEPIQVHALKNRVAGESGTFTVDFSGSITDFINQPQPTKGIEMSQAIATQKLIDTRTYINGVESSQVSDEKIFGFISNYESEIENLKKIKNQPKALKAKVVFIQSQIDELVAFVDARTVEVTA